MWLSEVEEGGSVPRLPGMVVDRASLVSLGPWRRHPGLRPQLPMATKCASVSKRLLPQGHQSLAYDLMTSS